MHLDDLLDVGNVNADAGLAQNLAVRAGVADKEELGALAELVIANHEAKVAKASLFFWAGGVSLLAASLPLKQHIRTTVLARAALKPSRPSEPVPATRILFDVSLS